MPNTYQPFLMASLHPQAGVAIAHTERLWLYHQREQVLPT
jgi:hypothetical protein